MQSQSNEPKRMLDRWKKSQNWKSHGNHCNLFIFHSYECQGIQIKNPFDEILCLNFDLGHSKMNNNVLNMNQFCKGLSKGLI